MTFYTQVRIQFLKDRRQAIENNIEAIGKQYNYTSNLAERENLDRQADLFFEKLKEVEKEIKQIESSVVKLGKEIDFSPQSLSKIDFKQAKKIVDHILINCFEKEGGLALFLLQNTSLMQGDLCVAEIQYCLSSNSYGRFKYCPIDPFYNDISDERSLLNAIADYFKPIEPHPNDQQYVQNIIGKISCSVQGGSIVFFDFINWDSMTENSDRLFSWFIEYFWNPLKQKHREISKDYSRVKFLLFISINSAIPEYYRGLIYCFNYNNFDCLKILELPLQNWEEGDIDDWLQEVYGLPKPKSKKIAEKIYKLSNHGIPVIVREKLEKYLPQLLKE